MDSPQRSLPDSVATAEPASEDVPMEDQDLLDFDAFFFQMEDVFKDLDKNVRSFPAFNNQWQLAIIVVRKKI